MQDQSEDAALCVFGTAHVDNSSDPSATVLEVRASGDAQLIRLIGWILDGLELDTLSADITNSHDSSASPTTTMRFSLIGHRSRSKLPDDDADLLAQQVADACRFCKPVITEPSSYELTRGPFTLYTLDSSHLVVDSTSTSLSARLVDLAMTISGIGNTIYSARLDDGKWFFDIVSSRGTPLLYQEGAGLLYCLEQIHCHNPSALLTPPL
jgi:hypothetical protein